MMVTIAATASLTTGKVSLLLLRYAGVVKQDKGDHISLGYG